jgi:hypothetical protein
VDGDEEAGQEETTEPKKTRWNLKIYKCISIVEVSGYF